MEQMPLQHEVAFLGILTGFADGSPLKLGSLRLAILPLAKGHWNRMEPSSS